ncbi:hypothetical protein HER39_20110, partial [Arthrobacter deserti]|nr:hypothetical protein [Arthrobacter deserti]
MSLAIRYTPAVATPGGKAPRQAKVRRTISLRWVLLGIITALVGLYLILPTLLVIPMSLSDSTSLGRLTGGWTLKWYQELFEDKDWAEAAGVSLQVGLLSTITSTVLGTAATFGLFK